MKRLKAHYVLPLLAFINLVVVIGSCSKEKDASSDSNAGTATFNLRMTDATGPFTAVNVDIQSVEVKTDNGGTILLNVSSGIYNLLDFTNGVDTLLATGVIPVSTVSQVRLILGPNNTVVVNGQTYPLQTPSAQQSGLKLQVHAPLQANVTYNMLLDFDANRSIVQTGNGSYILKPVIRVVATPLGGGIRGLIDPLAALPATIMAVMGTDTFTTSANATGSFLIPGIPTGLYTVTIYPTAPYLNDTIQNVSVTSGTITELGTITL